MRSNLFFACAAIVLALGTASCTEQIRARSWGGSTTIELEECRSLVNVTWKESSDLWILTRPMRADDEVGSYIFEQDSAFNILHGKVTINEHRGAACS